ncbi:MULTISPECIES: site-2 protease family protein [unclassified Novosphingobium]|uniref:site-2 protease family protein n=1 Tax=unclassified Novosphingobium TaxID=2644732 RepID=UPI000D3115EC|nr:MULTISPECIES: site-2 protease family protein [unclassified Novosphingobium]PTR06485.1 Zn-dependent protease [Novosphingobium sp. GV055]PUA94904.1 Zn-dependent protease [Novosphingobium sp. GV061]PUB13829.1 Zn-dependent protease [Novosphingobium sp. GV079]PUB38527.1 Zn-dependent protease [Novosphingobium sp. GV027]
MNDTLYSLATVAIPMIVAIVFHEVAHGRMARLLGDHTAQDMGRLSFNPLRHVDPVGTVILPGMLALAHAPVFGWARPVPVDVRGLPHPRRAMMLVGAAGPAMNFALAVVAALGLGVMARLAPGSGAVAQFVAANLVNFLAINLFLACFNLLPLPPFDGSHIVEGLLPRPAAQAYARLRPLGFPIMLVLLVVLPWMMPSLDPVRAVVVPPVTWLADHYLALAELVAGRPLG